MRMNLQYPKLKEISAHRAHLESKYLVINCKLMLSIIESS